MTTLFHTVGVVTLERFRSEFVMIATFTVNTVSTYTGRTLHMCCTLEFTLYTLQFRCINYYDIGVLR